MRFRLPGKWDVEVLSTLAWSVIAVGARTLRLTVENDAEVLRRLEEGKGQILVTWHGRNSIPLFHLRHRGVVIVISDSRDGEIQYQTYRRFGCDAVRGSTGRNAARVTIAALRKLREGRTLALAPDGPRGPAGLVQPGALYMAVKSGCPLIPAGVSAHPAWHLNSWDAFMVPRPFARAAIVFGEPIEVPDHADTEWIQSSVATLQDEINALQARADRLVGRRPEKTP